MKSEKEITEESKTILESDQRRVPIKEVDEKLEEVWKGSGNVFQDLGLDNPDELKRKADLWSTVYDRIVGKNASEISSILGVKEEHLLNLMNGKLDDFTIEQLSNFIEILGDE